jgi:hypothetical protein
VPAFLYKQPIVLIFLARLFMDTYEKPKLHIKNQLQNTKKQILENRE